jgi:ABC-type multidrug transport system fused ATPase/permease subunit
MYLLWSLFGPASIAGLGVIIILLPINAVLAGLASKQQKLAMKLRDDRLKSLYELLSGIKILKLYAWETPWAARVEDVREKEVGALANVAGWNAIQYGLFGCTGFLTILATFGTYVAWQQGPGSSALDPPRAFAGFALLSVLQIPLIMLPLAINATIQAKIALTRILPFLMAEELDPRSVNWRTKSEVATPDGALLRTAPDGGEAISVQRATVSWGGSADAFVLGKMGHELSFRCKRATLTAITGTVGSGKSSLISMVRF